MVRAVGDTNNSNHFQPQKATAGAAHVRKTADVAQAVVGHAFTQQELNTNAPERARIVPIVHFKNSHNAAANGSQKIAAHILGKLAEVYEKYGVGTSANRK